jgi:hypothetical protein
MYHKNAKSATAKTKIASTQKRPIAIDFNGGKLTSDAGAILLKLADKKLQFTKQIDAIMRRFIVLAVIWRIALRSSSYGYFLIVRVVIIF